MLYSVVEVEKSPRGPPRLGGPCTTRVTLNLPINERITAVAIDWPCTWKSAAQSQFKGYLQGVSADICPTWPTLKHRNLPNPHLRTDHKSIPLRLNLKLTSKLSLISMLPSKKTSR